MRIHLRRAAGEVKCAHLRLRAQKGQYLGDGFLFHQFGTLGSGVDMAMHAALIAKIAQVDLQGGQCRATDGRKVGYLQ
jgi:hypothetical protein